MKKKMEIISETELEDAINQLTLSAQEANRKLIDIVGRENSLETLSEIKFRKIGRDPLNSKRKLNLIEQVNQTFTYLASFMAVRFLLEQHPEGAPYRLNLGTSSGSDIESSKIGFLAAEVFSAVNLKNNRKLRKDLEKVSKVNAKHRYVFFMCPGYAKGKQEEAPEFPGIQIISVGNEPIP